jgi:hypothetical protein
MCRRAAGATVPLAVTNIIERSKVMPVAIVMDFEGGTLAQYDEVIERMGFQRGGEGAPGGLFHWVAQTDSGIRVTDVWETAEQYQQFAEEQIGPISQEVGVPAPPTLTFYELHNHLTAGVPVAS